MEDDSLFVQHEPCPSCGSRDNLARYTDGHAHCFGCNYHDNGAGDDIESNPKVVKARMFEPIHGEIRALTTRGISLETCRKYGYAVGKNAAGATVHIAPFFDAEGNLVAQKTRDSDKNFKVLGSLKSALLFGGNLWSRGKYVIVTEGEIDAMSACQAQGLRWPAVSVPNGASGAAKAISANLAWFDGFDAVVLMFDQDEPGQKAARQCAELFPPGKARIARLEMKDCNELLVAGRGEEIVTAMWGAKPYRPDGIVAGTDLWDTITAEDSSGASHDYPWPCLNTTTRGARMSELVLWCAGTGVGKSQVLREVAHSLIKKGETVGYIALEESTKRTALGLMSIELNKPLHLSTASGDEMRRAFDATVGNGRVFLYDHFGSTETESLLSKVRYLVVSCGAKHIVLDHISIVISGLEDGDERRLIDNVMTKLRSLVQELDCSIHLISHLRKAAGKPHERGGEITLDDLRGSASLKQLSDIIIALERDQQDEKRKHVTTLRVIKNRFSGETGIAGYLKYDTETGRMSECEPPGMFDDEDDAATRDF